VREAGAVEATIGGDGKGGAPGHPPLPSTPEETGPALPRFNFLGAPTDTYVARGRDAGQRTFEINAGDLSPLCDGKYEAEEVGSVFEDDDRGAIERPDPLRPPKDGTRVAVFREVSAEYEKGRKCAFKLEDYVYTVPRAQGEPMHVSKIAGFLSYASGRDPGEDAGDRVEGGAVQTDVVLLQRYLRANNSKLKTLGITGLLPGEVFETKWFSFRRVEEIFKHALVVKQELSDLFPANGNPSSSESHICRYAYDHAQRSVKPVIPPSPLHLDVAMTTTEEANPGITPSQEGTVKALELIGGLDAAADIDHSNATSNAGESDMEEDVIRESPVPASPSEPAPTPSPASKKRSASEMSQNGVLPFPLKLSGGHLRNRWTQERYENGQRFLFLAMMNKKAFSREQALNRHALRNGVKAMGIGDLGLVDHVIKTVTEQPVVFSGHYIKKQHNLKGILEYWLTTETPPAVVEKLDRKHASGKARKDVPPPPEASALNGEGIEASKTMLAALKDIRTTLAVLNDRVAKISANGAADQLNGTTKEAELTYQIVLQNAEEEVKKKLLAAFTAELETMLRPNQEEMMRLRQEVQGRVDSCIAAERENTKKIQRLDGQVAKSAQSLQDVKTDLAKVKKDGKSRKVTDALASKGEMENFRTDIMIMKAQHELFLAEGSARMDELMKQNIALREEIEELKRTKDARMAPAEQGYGISFK